MGYPSGPNRLRQSFLYHCPDRPKKIIEWEIPDPKGKAIEIFRNAGDMIEDRVRTLIGEAK
jgi:protein-tyrosine-phosphatase